MYKSVRQSMAWLHSWVGLLLGWLLFTIFLLGTLSYYKDNINLWMQPEFNQAQFTQEQAIHTGLQYAIAQGSENQSWYIQVASDDHPVNQIFIRKKVDGFIFKTLHPKTGEEAQLASTQGGEFLYNFHFQLFGIPIIIGRFIVCFAAFIMLIALISGVITHKKIFTDFFTFRTFKSQRSWLDFHNVVSVIALPFFLMITFTGLAIFFYLYLPSGIEKYYGKKKLDFFNELNTPTSLIVSKENPKPSNMIGIEEIQSKINQIWPEHPPIASIEVKQPYTTVSQIIIKQKEDKSITLTPAQIVLSGVNGEVLSQTIQKSSVQKIYGGIYSLHMAPFAQPLVRVALFISGILGCLMIASGLLLWSLKRQLKNKHNTFHFGHYMVNRFNVSALVGLPVAILAYFYSNRLYTLSHMSAPNLEISTFFYVWAITLISACIVSEKYLWQVYLTVFGVLAMFLPIVNIASLVHASYISGWSDYSHYVGLDLVVVLIGFFALFVLMKIKLIKHQVFKKYAK